MRRNTIRVATFAGPGAAPQIRSVPWPEVPRKAAVIQGVRHGLLTVEQACERYHLSTDEYRAWERDFHAHGVTAR